MSAYVPTLGTILVAIFTAIFGLYSYQRQKRVDRENYVAQKEIDRENYVVEKETDRKVELRNRRMKEYERYLTAYLDHQRWSGTDEEKAEKAVANYQGAYSNLFQIASDPVLLAVTDFHKVAWMQDTDLTGTAYRESFKDLYATMILAMRKDAFEATELPKELVEERLPWYFEDVKQ